MHLTHSERTALRNASTEGIGAVEQIVRQIQQSNPRAFHTAATLSGRTFHDEPGDSVPCQGFVHAADATETARARIGRQVSA
ncbi:hypothetical protein R75461_07897 [Paraburkholderia nemoris]|nr:hypothetical protein R75461_07897 [Paraburkholderia nemoris]